MAGLMQTNMKSEGASIAYNVQCPIRQTTGHVADKCL